MYRGAPGTNVQRAQEVYSLWLLHVKPENSRPLMASSIIMGACTCQKRGK